MKMDALNRVYDAAGIKKSARTLGWPLMTDIATKAASDFEASMKSFREWTAKCFSENCRSGCVPPLMCGIPKCSSSKGYVTCAECDEYDGCTMPNIKKSEDAVKCIEDIRAKGIDAVAKRKYEELMTRMKSELSRAINGIR